MVAVVWGVVRRHEPGSGSLRHPWVTTLSDDSWLPWFLRNHDPEPLIAAGLWKSPRLVALDLVGDPGVAAMRAAYALGGAPAAWSVLCELLAARVARVEEPEPLPEGWDARQRFYAQEYRVPSRPPIFGHFRKDRGR